MREEELNDLKERSWRRRLSPAESDALRQLLAGDGPASAGWEQDEALNRLLEQLPAAPAVSTNFTARVMASARAAERGPAPARSPWIFQNIWARLAAGAAMVCAGFFSFQEYHSLQMAKQAREVAAASRLAALPPVDWLNNFDTIQRLDKVKVADDELLSVLE